MFRRGFVLIWNKNRDTARFWRSWRTKTEMAPETFPRKSTPRTEYSFLRAKSGKKLWKVGFRGTKRCLECFFFKFFRVEHRFVFQHAKYVLINQGHHCTECIREDWVQNPLPCKFIALHLSRKRMVLKACKAAFWLESAKHRFCRRLGAMNSGDCVRDY